MGNLEYIFMKNKYIFTFGSDHLPELADILRPLKVMLIVEAENELKARDIVFSSFIGDKFCTSYDYEKRHEFRDRFNMAEYDLKMFNKYLRLKKIIPKLQKEYRNAKSKIINQI